jgi:5-formyltetrahydrofolate cyclo-ligase
MSKASLRQYVRQLKQMHSASQLEEQSADIIGRLRVVPQVKQAQTILLYYSLSDEVDTRQLLDELVSAGKTVLLPVVIGDEAMELRQYTGPNDLQGGFFDIMEPLGELFTDYQNIDVAVVPGMAFDSQGNRLGRGKGYYDRLLPQLTNAYKIGLCFRFQRLPGIPVDENDVRMDEVVC